MSVIIGCVAPPVPMPAALDHFPHVQKVGSWVNVVRVNAPCPVALVHEDRSLRGIGEPFVGEIGDAVGLPVPRLLFLPSFDGHLEADASVVKPVDAPEPEPAR